MGWLKIRDTEISVLDILELISQGQGIAGILVRLPGLAPTDIAGAAAVARSILIHHWAQCRSPEVVMRYNLMAAPAWRKSEAWTEDEDDELVGLADNGASLDNIARILLRGQSDVAQRLEKLSNE
jgi:uncharacterized protein (DUF433 family)